MTNLWGQLFSGEAWENHLEYRIRVHGHAASVVRVRLIHFESEFKKNQLPSSLHRGSLKSRSYRWKHSKIIYLCLKHIKCFLQVLNRQIIISQWTRARGTVSMWKLTSPPFHAHSTFRSRRLSILSAHWQEDPPASSRRYWNAKTELFMLTACSEVIKTLSFPWKKTSSCNVIE